MPLPVLNDLKAYLKVEHTAEDALLSQLLTRAKALVEGYLRRPILKVARSFTVDDGIGTLHLPLYPVNPTGVVVTDVDGDPVDAATYRVDRSTGMIIADAGEYFDNGPYTVTAPEVGLELAEEYSTTIEPLVSAAILDVAADLFWHRNPNSTNESEAGVSVSYGRDGIPPRVAATLAPYRRVGARV